MTFDYEQMRTEITAKRQLLLSRQKDIAKEKARLDEESQKIQQELVGLDHMLEGLQFMQTGGPPPDLEQLGFTDKVALVFQQANATLFPTQVRDELLQMGVKGSSSKNLLISVHNAIVRLGDSLLEEVTVDGRSAYKWKVDAGARGLAAAFRRPKYGVGELGSLNSLAMLAGLDPIQKAVRDAKSSSFYGVVEPDPAFDNLKQALLKKKK